MIRSAFSALLTVFSTLPSFHTNTASMRALFGLDTMIVVIFTIECVSRDDGCVQSADITSCCCQVPGKSAYDCSLGPSPCSEPARQQLVAHSDTFTMCWKWATSGSNLLWACLYQLTPRPRVTAFFAIVDLLAILPYYIEVALQQDTVRAPLSPLNGH